MKARRFFSAFKPALRIPLSVYVLCGIFIYAIIFLLTDRWKGDNWKNTVISDGEGYYAYLPATFIYHDYTYHFLDSLHATGRYRFFVGFCNDFNGHRVNKYFAGESVLVAPFYFTAHLLSGSTTHPRDGYSFYYQASISIAALFYLLLGLWALRKLLLRLKMKDWIIAVVLLSVFCGTNLSWYALSEPSMTHVYSFSLVCLFLNALHAQVENYSGRRLILIGLLAGLIVLVRPVNALIFLSLPFIAGSKENLLRFFRQMFSRLIPLLVAAITGGGIIAIQLLAYHVQCGHWYVYAYTHETFDFFHPRMFRLLFSYSNGFFVYAPLMLIAALGIFTFWKQNIFRFVSFVLFFIVLDWVLSSWWAWTYGGAFGMRPMVEYLPVFALLLAFLLDRISNTRKAFTALSVFLVFQFCIFTQFQTWQYENNIINWDRMTKEQYWRVFMKTGIQYYFIFSDIYIPHLPDGAREVYHYSTGFEHPDSLMDWNTTSTDFSFSGTHSAFVKDPDKLQPFWRTTVEKILPDSIYTKKQLWINIKVKCRLDDYGTDARILFTQKRKNDYPTWMCPFIIHQVDKEKQWMTYENNFMLQPAQPGDELSVRPYKEDHVPVYMDDLDITIYAK